MPQNDPTIQITDGNLGLVTNISSVEADKQSFRTLKNASVDKIGVIQDFNGYGTSQLNIGGTLTDIPSLPAGFTLESAKIFAINEPSNSECIVIFGSKGGRDRFYVWPDIVAGVVTTSGSGTFVSNTSIDWLELTEAEGTLFVDVVTSTTVFTFTSVENDTTNDYYNQWIIWNQDRGEYDLVTNYDSATGRFTIKKGITGVANGDNCVLMRFRVFAQAASVEAQYTINDEDALPSYATHGQDLVIHTGLHNINQGADLWLGYVNRSFFDDTDLDFNAWHFDYALPFHDRPPDMRITIFPVAETNDPMPDPGSTYWIPAYTLEFDGIQESNIFWVIDDNDFLFDYAQQYFANFKHQITLDIDIALHFNTESPHVVGATRNTFMSRRITGINCYMAAGELATGASRWIPKTEFYFMRKIGIDDADWSYSSGTETYQLTFDLFGSHWVNGQRFPFSRVVGYGAAAAGSTAKYEAQVGNRPVIAPIYDDDERKFRALFATVSQVGHQTMPDVYPITNRIDAAFAGISEILAILEQRGLLVMFGRETTAIADVTGARGGFIQEQVQKKGLVSPRAAVNIEGDVFMATDDSILEVFNGNNFIEPSPGFLIKPDWNAFTTAEKESAFFGYQKRNRQLFIAVGTTQRIFVYSLSFNRWHEYESDLTFLNFFSGTDNKLYGLTASSIVEINAETPTESTILTLETHDLVNRVVSIRECEMQYTSDVTLTLSGIDNSESITNLREKDTALFLTQDGMQSVDRELAFKTKRPRVKLVSAAGAAKNIEIDSISLYVIQKTER